MESPEVKRLQDFQDFYKTARSTFGGGISTAQLWFVFLKDPRIKMSRVGGHDDSRGELEGDKSQKGGGQSSDSHAINQGNAWTNWIGPALDDCGGTKPKVATKYQALKKLCKTYGWELDNTVGVKQGGGEKSGKADRSKRNEKLGEVKKLEKAGKEEVEELYSAAYSAWVKAKCYDKTPEDKDVDNFKSDFKRNYEDEFDLDIEADDDENINELWEEKLEELQGMKSTVIAWAKQQPGPVMEAKPTDHANFEDAFSAWAEATGAKGSQAKKTFTEDVWGSLAQKVRDNKKTVKITVTQYDKDGNKKRGKK